jgi:hypothetical protein
MLSSNEPETVEIKQCKTNLSTCPNDVVIWLAASDDLWKNQKEKGTVVDYF